MCSHVMDGAGQEEEKEKEATRERRRRGQRGHWLFHVQLPRTQRDDDPPICHARIVWGLIVEVAAESSRGLVSMPFGSCRHDMLDVPDVRSLCDIL